MKKLVLALSLFIGTLVASHADMLDGTPISQWSLKNSVVIPPPTAGRFLPVIEASGPGSSSPFIRMQFCRWNGDKVLVNGRIYTIPAGNCTSPSGGIISSFASACLNKVCGTSLSFPAAYYVGLYDRNGVLTMNYWPVAGGAGWTPGPNGLMVKGDDPTTTLIGEVYLNGTQTMDGTGSKQNSVSVFNKVRIPLFVSATGGGITGTSYSELNSNNRIEWVSIFGDEAFFVMASCTVSNTVVNGQTSVGIGLDSTTAPNAPGTFQATSAGAVGNATSVAPTDSADGHHFAALLTAVSSGTGAVNTCTMITTAFPS